MRSKKWKTILVLALAGVFFAGCGDDADNPPKNNTTNNATTNNGTTQTTGPLTVDIPPGDYKITEVMGDEACAGNMPVVSSVMRLSTEGLEFIPTEYDRNLGGLSPPSLPLCLFRH